MKKKLPISPWIFLYKLISFFPLVFFLGLNLQASPLLNVNIEESDEYDCFIGSSYSSGHSTTIRPFSYLKLLPFVNNINRLYLDLDNFTDIGYYWKPIKSIHVDTLYSQEKKYFMPGSSGLNYQNKANAFIMEDGFISLKNYFVLYYQLKQSFHVDANVNQGELFRAYAKMRVKKISLEAGIDNVALGPGEYGLILSNNTKPYPLVKLQSEDFFEFFGKLDFLLMHGWLYEGRDDYSKPKLIAGKLAWKPVNSIELGLTRLVFYGSALRDSYAIKDYPYLFYGYKNNAPGEDYNNLSFLSGDLSLIFPLNKIWSSFGIFKIYSEYAVNKTHILSSNQGNLSNDSSNYEQKDEFALLSGILLSTENSIFRFEYVSISKYFYYHLNYQNQGFSYSGFSLGYPYGYNTQSILFKYKYYISDNFFVESQFGGYQVPLFDPAAESSYSITQKEYTDLIGFSSNFDNKIRRYFILISSKVYLKPFILGLQFRVDKSYNYTDESMELFKNANNEKLIFVENKTLYFFNLSLSCQI